MSASIHTAVGGQSWVSVTRQGLFAVCRCICQASEPKDFWGFTCLHLCAVSQTWTLARSPTGGTIYSYGTFKRGGAQVAQQTPTAACVGCCFLFRFGRNLVKCSSLLPSSEGSSEINPELRFSCRMDGNGGSSMWIGTSSRALSRSNSISEIKQIPKQRVMQRG